MTSGPHDNQHMAVRPATDELHGWQCVPLSGRISQWRWCCLPPPAPLQGSMQRHPAVGANAQSGCHVREVTDAFGKRTGVQGGLPVSNLDLHTQHHPPCWSTLIHQVRCCEITRTAGPDLFRHHFVACQSDNVLCIHACTAHTEEIGVTKMTRLMLCTVLRV